MRLFGEKEVLVVLVGCLAIPCTFPCIPVLFPAFSRYSCITRLAHGSTPVPRD
jgi:hypothetical protein